MKCVSVGAATAASLGVSCSNSEYYQTALYCEAQRPPYGTTVTPLELQKCTSYSNSIALHRRTSHSIPHPLGKPNDQRGSRKTEQAKFEELAIGTDRTRHCMPWLRSAKRVEVLQSFLTKTPRHHGTLARFRTHPNLSVHMPIIPQSGIRIVTTLVTTNYGNSQESL